EKYPNLAGIKDSVDDVPEYERFVAEFPKLNMRTGTDTNLKYALDHGMGAILAEGNNFTKQIAAVFAAKRAGKDFSEPLAKLNAALKILREGGVDSYGPMKYALSLQMGTRQFYQRPPNSDVTDEQKAKIKQAFEQINASNFNDLEIAWRIKTDNFGNRPEYKLEGTPLMVNGVLYATAGSRRAVIALDPATGELLWIHGEREGKRGGAAPRQLSGRGLAYWSDGREERILYVTPGYRLICLNAKNGIRVPSFGENGRGDLE